MRLNAELAIFFTVLGIIALSLMVSPWSMLVLMLLALGVFLVVSRILRYLNDRNVEQFVFLNEQLKLQLSTANRSWFTLEWQYPSLAGDYLGKKITINMFNADVLGITAPHTRIIVDATHYGKTLEIRSEGIYTQFEKLWLRAAVMQQRFVAAILRHFGREPKPITDEVAVDDWQFDRRFFIMANDAKFAKKLLDDDIRDIMKNDVFMKMGHFRLLNSQLIYTEQIVINTDFERQRLQKIVLLMYMMAKRMEIIR